MARQLGGEKLAGWVVLSSAMSNIGLFEAEMSSDSYQLLGMAQKGAPCAARCALCCALCAVSGA